MILRNTGHVGYKYSIQPEKEKGDDTDEEEVGQMTDFEHEVRPGWPMVLPAEASLSLDCFYCGYLSYFNMNVDGFFYLCCFCVSDRVMLKPVWCSYYGCSTSQASQRFLGRSFRCRWLSYYRRRSHWLELQCFPGSAWICHKSYVCTVIHTVHTFYM